MFTMLECFYYYDGPLLFSATYNNELLLCIAIDEGKYLGTKITDHDIILLKQNVSLYTLLYKETCFIFNELENTVEELNADDVPKEYWPTPGVGLNPE